MKKIIETFAPPSNSDIRNMETSITPTSFNALVRVLKYRITIEVIDEPLPVIQERIKTLWRQSTNHHDWAPLQSIGKKYKLQLDHSNKLKED